MGAVHVLEAVEMTAPADRHPQLGSGLPDRNGNSVLGLWIKEDPALWIKRPQVDRAACPMWAVVGPGPAPCHRHSLEPAIAPSRADHEAQAGIGGLRLAHHPGESWVESPEVGLMVSDRVRVPREEHRELI